jgi:hypothetical protein
MRLYRRLFKPGDILVIRHEDLHQHYPSVKKKLCKFAQVKEDASINTASYFYKPWDGTNKAGSLSTRAITSNSPDPRFVSDDWKKGLTPFELAYIQFFLGGLMAEFNYPGYSGKVEGRKQKPLDYRTLFAQFLGLHSTRFLGPANRLMLRTFDFFFGIPAIRTLMKWGIHCGIMAQELFLYSRMCWLYVTCK